MRDVLADIQKWTDQGKAIALATVVQTWGSAPRTVGSKMAVSGAGEMSGSVSGGCVEGAVVQEALAVLRTGRPKLLHFGVSDEQAWEVGLACGGEIDVWVEPLAALQQGVGRQPSLLGELEEALAKQEPIVRAVVTRGVPELLGQSIVVRLDGQALGDLDPALDERVRLDGQVVLRSGRSETKRYALRGQEAEVFFDLMLSPPTLIVVGGVHIAIELTRLAKVLGYLVVVVDPRQAFATPARFPQADRLVASWPDEALHEVGLTHATAVAVLSHDPKLDDPALMIALRSSAFYVGALGSLRTHAQRRERLLQAGLTEEELARLSAPIGLDLGGRAPEEIALSILAEIVAARSGRTSPGAPPSAP